MPRRSPAFALRCPVRAWWGEQDAVLSSQLAPEELIRDLQSRGIAYDVVPGLDHQGMLERLDLVLPAIAPWLAEGHGAQPHTHMSQQPGDGRS